MFFERLCAFLVGQRIGYTYTLLVWNAFRDNFTIITMIYNHMYDEFVCCSVQFAYLIAGRIFYLGCSQCSLVTKTRT